MQYAHQLLKNFQKLDGNLKKTQYQPTSNIAYVCFNYRGVCNSTGEFKKMDNFVEDLKNIHQFAQQECHVNPHQITIVAHSISGGPATEAAYQLQQEGKQTNLILTNTYAELASVIKPFLGPLTSAVRLASEKLGLNINPGKTYPLINPKHKAHLNGVGDKIIRDEVCLNKSEQTRLKKEIDKHKNELKALEKLIPATEKEISKAIANEKKHEQEKLSSFTGRKMGNSILNLKSEADPDAGLFDDILNDNKISQKNTGFDRIKKLHDVLLDMEEKKVRLTANIQHLQQELEATKACLFKPIDKKVDVHNTSLLKNSLKSAEGKSTLDFITSKISQFIDQSKAVKENETEESRLSTIGEKKEDEDHQRLHR